MRLLRQFNKFLFGVLIGLILASMINTANAETLAPTCTSKVVKESTPKVFKKSSIKRKLADGTIQEFNGDNYKIVPRKQVRTKCAKPAPVVIVKEIKKIKRQRNHLQLYVGNGPSDSLSTSFYGNSASVTSEDENLLGISYSRDIIDFKNSSLSLGGFYFSNETVGASVGLSW